MAGRKLSNPSDVFYGRSLNYVMYARYIAQWSGYNPLDKVFGPLVWFYHMNPNKSAFFITQLASASAREKASA